MSHHYSGPDFGFPLGDARLDLTDVYVFPKPGERGKSILIMNVHPSSTVVRPEPTTAEPFAPDALYEVRIDTNGDGVADIAYRVRASALSGKMQVATLTRAEGLLAAGTGDEGRIIFDRAPVSEGPSAQITLVGDYRFFAGWRSDPFFFDTLGALNNLQFTGSDFFANKNVCSIVLEIPNTDFGSKAVTLWARTVSKRTGAWVQVERGARPQQGIFLPGSEQEAYAAGDPANDAQFIPVFAHALQHTGGYLPNEAERVSRTLLPDVLSYDPTRPASFPDNGRTLTDDAADVFISVLTNGKITGDQVGHHSDLTADFPYLGPPHP